MASSSTSRSFRTFTVIWFGQLVSTLGSGLTGFALGVWIYQETGSTTLFAMNMLAFAIPTLIMSPFAGALVDRYDRRWMMILSDTGAGLSTLAVAVLLLTDNLEIPYIFIATAFNAAFTSFQWPAYSAVTSLLVPRDQLGRASGMVQIGQAISQLLAPAAAGALLVTVGLEGIILIDFATFGVAVLTLLVVHVPKPAATAEGEASKGSIWKEAAFGWRYIVARPGLLGLLLVFAVFNLLSGINAPLIVPMILDMTTADVLGYMASIVGLGMLIGTLVMSAWGGPKRKINGVLGFLMLSGGATMLFGLTPYLAVMAIAGFIMMFAMPIINGSSQAIWQRKVDADVQGRVFSVRRMIAWSMTPIAYAIAGVLNDNVFKPLLVEGGALADSITGRVIGVGPSRGTGLLFIVLGFLSILTAASGYLNPRVRNVETELPDAELKTIEDELQEQAEDVEDLQPSASTAD